MDTNFQGNEQIPVQGNFQAIENPEVSAGSPQIVDSNMNQVVMPQPVIVDTNTNGITNPTVDIPTGAVAVDMSNGMNVSSQPIITDASVNPSVSMESVPINVNINPTAVSTVENRVQPQVVPQEVQVTPVTSIPPVQVSVDANIHSNSEVVSNNESVSSAIVETTSSNNPTVSAEVEGNLQELASVNVQNIVTPIENNDQSISIKESLEEKKEIEKQQLLVKPENLITGKHYRISILTERLIRFEYSPTGTFYDNKSQWVQFRNFDKVNYEINQDDKFLVIKTKYFAISYSKEKNFDGGKIVPSSNLRVDLNNTDRAWYYKHPEVKNYKGVCVGLDGTDEDMKLRNGLFSLDGFASIDDSNSYIYDENDKLVKRDNPGIDVYVFMYNNDFDLAIQDYLKLTGMPPMIPRYALGNWWCRDLPYTDEELRQVVNSFEKREIPLSVLLLDKDWHLRESADKKILDTGYTFNKDLIPDPSALIKEFHEKNIRVGLYYDPENGIYPHEEHYPEIAKMFGVTDNKVIAFDPLNPVLLDVIFQKLLKPLREMGVDFFWNDYKKTDKGTDELWFLNHYLLENDPLDRSIRNVTLARSALIAPHQQPIMYSGKTMVGWEMLKKIPSLNQAASNIGVSWISHDVAGNYGGIEEEELYIRSIELAVFSPILRFHAPAGRYYRREPWRWNARTLEVVDDYLKLRHRFIPYIYSKAYLYHHDGIPLIKPLYREVPWVYDDKNFSDEYYFGELLISPIMKKKDMLINRTIHKFYLPDGVWYDFRTGKKFPGNKQYVSFFRDEDYPVFARRGAIIPLDSTEKLNFTGTPEALEIHIFPGESNSFKLYEDDGTTDMYKEGKYLITQIEYNYLPSNYTVIVRNLDGTRSVLPDYRNYKIRFRNTKKAQDIMAYFNDTELETTSYVDDADFVIEVNNVPSFGQLTINCKGKDIEIDAVRLINDEIDSILLDLPINTVLKEKISSIMFSDLPIKKKRIEVRKLSKFNLTREYIKLFLKLLEYIGDTMN